MSKLSFDDVIKGVHALNSLQGLIEGCDNLADGLEVGSTASADRSPGEHCFTVSSRKVAKLSSLYKKLYWGVYKELLGD